MINTTFFLSIFSSICIYAWRVYVWEREIYPMTWSIICIAHVGMKVCRFLFFRGNYIYYILLSELILLLWFKENYIDFDVFPNRNSFALNDHGKSFPQERRLAFPFNLVEKVVTRECSESRARRKHEITWYK